MDGAPTGVTDWPKGSLLNGLGPVERAALLRLGTVRRFDRGLTLMREGETDRDLYVLLRGYVKVLGDTRDGRTNMLAIRVAGDVVGEIAALDNQPRSASVVAVTPVTTRVIDWATFDGYLSAHPSANVVLRQSILAKLRQSTRFRVNLGGASVYVRLAGVLCQLALSYGRQTPDGLLIDVPLSQVECAEFVGAAEPSVHRALAELRRRDLIRTGYRRLYVTDFTGLYAAATGA